MLSLRDKANVALGLTALQNNSPERARTYLERVRLRACWRTRRCSASVGRRRP